jgi:exosortase H (IPTLxxWG-CTERM-specific)
MLAMKSASALSAPTGSPGYRPESARRFLLIFLGTVAAYYALTLSPWVDAHLLYPVMTASASASSVLLHILGIKTTVAGVVVSGANFSVAVRRGCDPLEPMVLFAAGVLGFPAPWRCRLAGMFIGWIILFGLNLVRLASLFLLGAEKSPWFDGLHLWGWPAGYILCALALWVVWLRWVMLAPETATAVLAEVTTSDDALKSGGHTPQSPS